MVVWLLLCADKTGKGHSGVEGRLLLGHAGSGSRFEPGAADKSLEGQHLGAAAD